MGCYLLAAIALVAALLARSFAPVLRAALGAALGTALAGLYLLPAAWEQRWVDVRQAISDPGLLVENSWIFARHADPALVYHDIELHKVSIIAFSMIAVALTSLFICWLRGASKKYASNLTARRWWILLALIPLAILFLQLPLSLPLWNLLPKLRFLQFPWRWLVALEAPMAIFLVAALWPRKCWPRTAVAALCAAFFLGATVYAGHTLFQSCDEHDSVSGMLAAYRNGAGFEGYDWDTERWSLWIGSPANHYSPPLQDTPGNDDYSDFGSAHATSLNMSLCDGSVRTISYWIDPAVHANLCNRKDGVAIDAKQIE